MLSDQDIMQRVQAGETCLFDELVVRYRPRLLRFASSKFTDLSTAEDLVQETFLAAFSARTTYKSSFAFSTWLWTIALNLSRLWAKQVVARSQQVQVYQQRHSRSPAVPPEGLKKILQDEQRKQLLAWFDQLPEAQADALRLRFFAELSFEDIAAAMDSSLSGAKVRVRKGLEQLTKLASEAQATAESE
jgi:RNA polymerase sigma-70 factor (ECF subfamily)